MNNNQEKVSNLVKSQRASYLVSKALYSAIEDMHSRREELREYDDIEDMKYIYNKIFPSFREIKFTLPHSLDENDYENAYTFTVGARGQYLIAKALYLTTEWLIEETNKHDELSDREDMLMILEDVFPEYHSVIQIEQMLRNWNKQPSIDATILKN